MEQRARTPDRSPNCGRMAHRSGCVVILVDASQHRVDGHTVKLRCKVRCFDFITSTVVPTS